MYPFMFSISCASVGEFAYWLTTVCSTFCMSDLRHRDVACADRRNLINSDRQVILVWRASADLDAHDFAIRIGCAHGCVEAAGEQRSPDLDRRTAIGPSKRADDRQRREGAHEAVPLLDSEEERVGRAEHARVFKLRYGR